MPLPLNDTNIHTPLFPITAYPKAPLQLDKTHRITSLYVHMIYHRTWGGGGKTVILIYSVQSYHIPLAATDTVEAGGTEHPALKASVVPVHNIHPRQISVLILAGDVVRHLEKAA